MAVPEIRGYVMIAWMGVTSIFGALFGYGLLFPLLIVSPSKFRTLYDRLLLGPWFAMIAGLLEYLLGIHTVITGDAMLPGERSLIIMNHRTCLDWMYFWSVLVRESGVSTEKIILKSPLKKIPGAGWAMQVGAFMFLNRKWEEDKVIFRKLINYFADINYKTQVLLFPEGTDLTAWSRGKSNNFARWNNVAPYKYVLHPRTTGFSFLTNHMIHNEHLDAVYDVTVGYPFNFPKKEFELVQGNFPKEVHFHIKRHAVQSLPVNVDGLSSWCRARWAEKEQRLKHFYERTKSFDCKQDKRACDRLSAQDRDNEEVIFKDQPSREMRKKWKSKLAVVYWTTLVVLIAWMLFNCAILRYYALFHVVFFLYMSHKYGGFEIFQVDYYNRFFSTEQSQKKKH